MGTNTGESYLPNFNAPMLATVNTLTANAHSSPSVAKLKHIQESAWSDLTIGLGEYGMLYTKEDVEK